MGRRIAVNRRRSGDQLWMNRVLEPTGRIRILDVPIPSRMLGVDPDGSQCTSVRGSPPSTQPNTASVKDERNGE